MEIAKRIYIGGGDNGTRRLAKLEELAETYFRGNMSALFNDAVNKLYGLDPRTGVELTQQELVNEPRAPKWPIAKIKRVEK